MKSTDDNRSARVHTLAIGRLENTPAVALFAGCTSSQTAFQPGCNVQTWVAICAHPLGPAVAPMMMKRSRPMALEICERPAVSELSKVLRAFIGLRSWPPSRADRAEEFG